MPGAAALMALFACSAPRGLAVPAGPPEGAPRTRESMFLLTLAGLRTAEAVREVLGSGFTERERHCPGFDGITLAQRIEDVALAVAAERAGVGDPGSAARLAACVDLYLAAAREAAVRRSVGTASCLPPVR